MISPNTIPSIIEAITQANIIDSLDTDFSSLFFDGPLLSEAR